MKKARLIAIGILIFTTFINVKSQTFLDSTKLNFSGFIKADYVYDSRQIVDSRENLFLFYPKDNSISDHDESSYNQYALISRLRANIKGPGILGAQSSAALEGDFSGASNNDIDGFRLRHAYFKLDWDKTTALFGQYWHPLTIPVAFPKVLSLNIGAPFHAFNRGPQVRIEHRPGSFKLIGVVTSQRDFANTGPEGYSPKYMYNGGIPDMHAQVHFLPGNWTIGIGGGYKAIAPAREKYQVNDKLTALSFTGFVKLNTDRSRLVLQAIYGENLYDHLMMGGYSLRQDSMNNQIKMTNIPATTFWADYKINIKNNWNAGVFIGYAVNNQNNLKSGYEYYVRGKDIDFVYRVSPRIIKNIKNIMAGLELEYTAAKYRYEDVAADNTRLSLILLYRF